MSSPVTAGSAASFTITVSAGGTGNSILTDVLPGRARRRNFGKTITLTANTTAEHCASGISKLLR